MKKVFFIILIQMIAITLTARDFDAVTPSGHTIYCDIVVGGVKIVGWEHSPTDIEPVHLVIPSLVNNGSVNMRVVAIGDNAFQNSKNLVSLELPTTIKSIGREAFIRCVGLGSIVIPSSVDSIGENAFKFLPNVEYSGTSHGAPWGALNINAHREGQYYYSDSSKRHIVCCDRDATEALIPPTVVSIGDNAFTFCCGITSVAINSFVEHLGSSVFSSCHRLENVSFNPRLSSGDDGIGAFSNCTGLKRVLFGDSVHTIPSRCFEFCSSLERVIIPDNITRAGTSVFANCTSLISAFLGNGLTEISNSLFEGCTSLKHAVMPDGLEYLRSYTFENCSSLETVYLGKQLRSIGSKSFINCSSLIEIVLPSNINNIGTNAFKGCRNIGRIVCMTSSVPTMGAGVFDSVDTAAEIIVPCGSIDLYSQDSQWGRFDSIVGKSYYMVVTTNNPSWGDAVVTRQPTCEDNTSVIEAIPTENCRFVSWSDGSTDNPRQIVYDGEGYAYRKAVFASLVGIGSVEAQPDIKVYGSSGSIVIEGADGETVRVFDMMGRQILGCIITSSHFNISTSRLTRGIYLVKIGNRKARKVVL
ncbi:MAG: leucine-rich repeat domain-containing protein [Bacteroidales bacterium]|nr:leucine-rich repeat domain-containing protein [Bacteroidales bacterium]